MAVSPLRTIFEMDWKVKDGVHLPDEQNSFPAAAISFGHQRRSAFTVKHPSRPKTIILKFTLQHIANLAHAVRVERTRMRLTSWSQPQSRCKNRNAFGLAHVVVLRTSLQPAQLIGLID